MKTISLTTNDRPHYLRQCLDCLAACEGVEDWVLCVVSEPNYDCIEMIRGISFMRVNHFRNQVQMGVNPNTYLAVEHAFRIGSGYNVYLEDDVLLSRDALTLAEQHRCAIFPELLAFRRRKEDLAQPQLVCRSAEEGLLGCGFAMWTKDWPRVRSHWFEVNPPEHKGETWDLALGAALEAAGTLIWRPMVNRSRHIGVTGTHTSV